MRALFESHGEIVSVKLVKDKTTGQSAGFGFVKYRNEKAANAAIQALNGRQMDGKRLKVSLAKPNPEDANTNLYITGLPVEWREPELNGMLSVYGSVTESKVLLDQNGTSKGVGLARMVDNNSAKNAIAQLNNTTPDGASAKLMLKFADTPKDAAAKKRKLSTSAPAAQGATPAFPFAFPGMPFGYPGSAFMYPGAQAQTAAPSNPYAAAAQSAYGFGSTDSHSSPWEAMGWSSPLSGPPASATSSPFGGVCLFLYHLANEVDEAALSKLFGGIGQVVSCKIMKDMATSKSKGFGFINMATAQQAERAIAAFNGYELNGKKLAVKYKT